MIPEDFETWWAKQTANFDPEEIGLMQLARVTWNAAQDIEREACARVCEEDAFVDQWRGLAEAAKRIRERSNAEITGRTLAQNEADGA